MSERGSSLMCKHVLAIHLGEALNEKDKELIQVKMIEDNDFTPLLLSSKNHLQKYEQKLHNSNGQMARAAANNGFRM